MSLTAGSSSNVNTTVQLYGVAEAYIRLMHLSTDHEKQTIRGCISRYAKPDTFTGILNWLVFRVTNAFNSLFGSSEWQTAKKVIQHRAIFMATQKGFFSNGSREIQNKIQDMVAESTLDKADSMLKFCLRMQEIRAPSSTLAEFADILQSHDLDYYLDNHLRPGVERVRAGSST